MWVPGLLAYLVPVGLLVMQLCGQIGNSKGLFQNLILGSQMRRHSHP